QNGQLTICSVRAICFLTGAHRASLDDADQDRGNLCPSVRRARVDRYRLRVASCRLRALRTEARSVDARRRARVALEERPEEADVLVSDGAADVGDAAGPGLQQVAGSVDAQAVQVRERRLARRRREP